MQQGPTPASHRLSSITVTISWKRIQRKNTPWNTQSFLQFPWNGLFRSIYNELFTIWKERENKERIKWRTSTYKIFGIPTVRGKQCEEARPPSHERSLLTILAYRWVSLHKGVCLTQSFLKFWMHFGVLGILRSCLRLTKGKQNNLITTATLGS